MVFNSGIPYSRNKAGRGGALVDGGGQQNSINFSSCAHKNLDHLSKELAVLYVAIQIAG